jgi:hypothetical protein
MKKQAENDGIRSGVTTLYPPVLLLIASALLIYRASGYGETARQLPVLVASGTLVLVVLDILSRLGGKVGGLIRSALGAGFHDREMTTEPRWQSELTQLAWVGGSVTSIMLIGILPTVPAFIFMYMLIQGRQDVLSSAIVSLLVLFLVGVLFEFILDYELYKGLIFDRHDN